MGFLFLLPSTLLSCLFASYTLAATVSTQLNIVNGEVNLDGFSRPAVLAGGTFPGPIINVNKGDRLEINVTNELTISDGLDVVTTVHWHGIDQLHSNWADGVDSVTQCPIIPGNSFVYNFTIPDQAGTFFYHSHYSDQYCDGLRGALIVRDPQDPQRDLYDVDDDTTVITLSDWYHYLSKDAGGIPAPNSTLINGVGRYPGGPTNVSLAIVNVKAGTRYRFRLISMSCDPNFVFSIDQHVLTVIEADGNAVKPHEVSSIKIFAAQRYSFVLKADQPADNYWIRAIPNSETNNNTKNGLNSAILNYEGIEVADPISKELSSKNPLVETNLHPLEPSLVPDADVVVNLNFGFDGAHGKFTANGKSFTNSDPMPVLLQVMSGKSFDELLPAGSVYHLPRNKTIEVQMPALALAGPHPLHLHGHAFWVVESAGNNTRNTVDPLLRDVVAISTGPDDTESSVKIRFRTDNPGPWILHCHIDWHLTAGFAVVFAEASEDVEGTVSPPPAWDELCPAYNTFVQSTGKGVPPTESRVKGLGQ
ncbi:multicopper oxidase [Peniophora sp. CONT]|nr:multicopper oxidase [Peniophora sp. CONT]